MHDRITCNYTTIIIRFNGTSLKIVQLPAFWGPRSHLRGPKFQKFSGGACPQTPLGVLYFTHCVTNDYISPLPKQKVL